MHAWPLNVSAVLRQPIHDLAVACGDIWNLGLQQRRNKYAWGKADFASQQAEILGLQSEDPELAIYPSAALTYPIWRLDQDYASFLQELARFKKKQRSNMPPLPQPWPAQQPFPIYLGPNCLERRGEVGIWRWTVTTLRLPLHQIPPFERALLHVKDEQISLEPLNIGP
jgi:hypothetical protein